MIKLGVCAGVDNIQKIAAAGYDYIELSFGGVAEADDETFARICSAVDSSPIKVNAMNGMLPGRLPVTGPDVNEPEIRKFLETGFFRANRLGTKAVVFGSGGSRRIKDGFDTAESWRQIANYLRIVEEYASQYDIYLAIEPLRKAECNIINFVSEATLLSSLLELPHICVLGDYYHMCVGNESVESIRLAGKLMKHIHIAHPETRQYPRKGDGADYGPLFETLKDIGYEGGVSLEGGCSDFDRDIAEAFSLLDGLRK